MKRFEAEKKYLWEKHKKTVVVRIVWEGFSTRPDGQIVRSIGIDQSHRMELAAFRYESALSSSMLSAAHIRKIMKVPGFTYIGRDTWENNSDYTERVVIPRREMDIFFDEKPDNEIVFIKALEGVRVTNEKGDDLVPASTYDTKSGVVRKYYAGLKDTYVVYDGVNKYLISAAFPTGLRAA